MKSCNSHVYKVAFLSKLMEELERCNVPLEKLIQKSNIKRFDLSDPEKYLPATTVYSFLESVKQDQSINSIAITFNDCFRLINIGKIGTFFLQSPNLLYAIQACIKYGTHFHTNRRVNLEISGPFAKFSCQLIDPFSPGKDIAEDIGMAMFIDTFKLVSGSLCELSEIHIRGDSLEKIESFLPVGDYLVQYNQPGYALVFPTSMLQNKIRLDEELPIIFKPQCPALNFAANFEKVFWNIKPGYKPNLNDLSAFFNMSPRTIKRHLMKECTTFSEIKSQTLFLKAMHLLSSTNLKVREISEYLGYTDSQNFIRSFRKWTGTTPFNFKTKFAIGPK